MKDKDQDADNPPAEAAGGMAGKLLAMLRQAGLENAEIEENGTKIRVDKGEIHVVDKAREIHIGKTGIRIRKIDGGTEPPKP